MKKNSIYNVNSLPFPKGIKRKKYNVVAGKYNDMLQLTIYTNKDKKPSRDIFIDKINEDWLSIVYHQSKPITYSEAMISNVYDSHYYPVAYSGEEILEEIFPDNTGKGNYISVIGKWQLAIHHKKCDEKLKVIFDKWDEELTIFPKKILPSFEKFMKKEADGRYFLFYKNKESKIGYCSHCGKEVPLMKIPYQNKNYRCPSCRVVTTFKQQDKVQTLESYKYNGAYAQKIKDKIIIRKFVGTKNYRGCDYKNPNTYLYETKRYILYKDGSISVFWLGDYDIRHYRWIKQENKAKLWTSISPFESDRINNVYKKNLSFYLKNSSWNCWKKKPNDLITYMIIEHQTKGLIEKLAKVGLFNIAIDFMDKIFDRFNYSINENGKNLGQILKLDKTRLKRLCTFDNIDYYNWLKKEKENNTIYDDEMLKNFVNAKLYDYSFKGLPEKMSYTQINNYIIKQSKLSYEEYNQVLTTWKDYLCMAKDNGWDINNSIIYKPADLKEMHTKAILFRDGSDMEKEIKKLEKKWPKVNENLALMKSFEYENEEFCIIVPNGIADIVREGHSLQHCIHKVSDYFDRTEKRETYLFFLRKKSKPNLSWYTLEVEQNGNIMQKRSTGDNQYKDLNIAIPFLREFQKYFVSKMTEEDKLLGIKAEESRKKLYRDYRKNLNKISHGRLAGKLLADVLEEDLMIA